MAATENREHILAVLDQLPPLHQVAQKLISLMNDDRSSAQDLDRLIRNDQALTAHILKLANSSAYGKSRNIFQLSEAVILLGHTTIGNLVLGSAVADVVGGGQDQDFWERTWAHSLDCGAASQALAELTGTVPAENAFVAGLLHDIGLLVQAQAVPATLRKIIQSQPADPLAAERKELGLNHAQIGLKLLDRWHLPVPLCEAVRFHHAPNRKYQRTNPLINIVALADRLTVLSGNSIYSQHKPEGIFQLLRLVGIEPSHFDQMFKGLSRSQENVRCLREEAQLTSRPATPNIEPVIDPVFLSAADDKRLAWYSAVLTYFGTPILDWQPGGFSGSVSQNAKHVVVDFFGMSPDERQKLSQYIADFNLTPIVVGDPRHTPKDGIWQHVRHLPEFFTRDEFVESLVPVVPVSA